MGQPLPTLQLKMLRHDPSDVQVTLSSLRYKDKKVVCSSVQLSTQIHSFPANCIFFHCVFLTRMHFWRWPPTLISCTCKQKSGMIACECVRRLPQRSRRMWCEAWPSSLAMCVSARGSGCMTWPACSAGPSTSLGRCGAPGGWVRGQPCLVRAQWFTM